MSDKRKKIPDSGPFSEESQWERIETLKARAAEGGAAEVYEGEDVSEEVQEDFWEGIASFGEETIGRPVDILRREGVDIPPAEELDDEDLHEKLWGVILAMSMHHWYLQRTDHLSDRQLYEELVDDLLVDAVPPTSPGTNMHIDILGGCSDHDNWIAARYYWDERDRADWMKWFPDEELPERVDPPYDRDRHLPRPPRPGEPRLDGSDDVM